MASSSTTTGAFLEVPVSSTVTTTNTTTLEDNTQSGSFDLRAMMASTRKHERKMGKIRTAYLPQRLAFSEQNHSGGGGTHPERVTPMPQRYFGTTPSATSSQKPVAHRPHRPMPLPLFQPTPTNPGGRSVLGGSELADQPLRSLAFTPKERFHSSTSRLAQVPEVTTPSSQSSFSQDHHNPDSLIMKWILIKGKKYALLTVLGKGGSSQVYEVFDEERNLKAIKIVDLSEADEAQARGYLNEINMLEKLQGHHRIVRMFDYEYRPHEGKLFIVMERGETDLSTLIKRISANHEITELKIKFYWNEMLEAVQVIHEAGIIHSDLKPANFILVAGTLKLIDFGIASSVQSDKTSVVKESQMGTFNFMSPEAIQSGPVDDNDGDDEDQQCIKISRKSDVWSLGCILYNLTYKKMPFGHFRRPLDKFRAITDPEYKIPFPSDGHDPLLVDVIKRCLMRDPRERASVAELLNHPFLKSKNLGTNNNAKTTNTNVEQLLSKLGTVLTPNSKQVLSQAMRKISTSETSLNALRHLDLTADET